MVTNSSITQELIAQRAGVSRTTVSQVLSGRGKQAFSAKTRESILRIADEMGYTSRFMPVDVAGETGTIGLMLLENYARNPYYAPQRERLTNGMMNFLTAQGGHLLLIPVREDFVLEANVQRKIDGAVVGFFFDPLLERLPPKFPVVSLTNTRIADMVTPDYYSALCQAVRHLHQLGHRRIALFGLGPLNSDSIDRLRGYRDTLDALALPVDDNLVAIPACEEGGLPEIERFAQAALERWHALPQPPTGIVTFGDVYAIPLMRMAQRLGINVPRQLSIVGCDNEALSSMTEPALTTIALPMEEWGWTACEMLYDRLEHPTWPLKRLMLEVTLVERGSTAPPHGD